MKDSFTNAKASQGNRDEEGQAESVMSLDEGRVVLIQGHTSPSVIPVSLEHVLIT